jgi:hypothetical protein
LLCEVSLVPALMWVRAAGVKPNSAAKRTMSPACLRAIDSSGLTACRLPSEILPARDRNIDIDGVQLDGAAQPAGHLGGDHRGARADERIVDQLTGLRVVFDRALHALDRLLRAVIALVILSAGSAAARRIHSGDLLTATGSVASPQTMR